MKTRFFAVIAVCCAALSACPSGAGSEDETSRLREELEQQYAAWKSLSLSDYQFETKYSRALPDSRGDDEYITVTIRNGVFENAFDHWKKPAEAACKSIEMLFDKIRGDLDDDENKVFSASYQTGNQFYINYDEQYHYPADYTRWFLVDYDKFWEEEENSGFVTGFPQFSFVVCSFTPGAGTAPEEQIPPQRAELMEKYAAWEALDIQNYKFSYSYYSNYGSPFYSRDVGPWWEEAVIIVKDGTFYRFDGEGENGAYNQYTIKKVFDHVMRNVINAEKTENEEVELRYNPWLHFPVSCVLYRIANERKSNLGEFTVSTFFPLEE